MIRRTLGRLLLFALLVYGLSGFLVDRVHRIEGVQGHVAEAVLPETGANFLRGVVSIHTDQSHDATGTIDDVADAARAADLDFVLLGDHPPAADPYIPYVIRDSVFIVYGEEMSMPDTGRILAFGMRTPFTRDDSRNGALWDSVSAGGAAGIVIHSRSPREGERWHWPTPGPMIGWEAFDISESARRALSFPWALYRVGELLVSAALGRTSDSLLRFEPNGFGTPAVAAYDSMSFLTDLTALAGLNHHPKLTFRGRPIPDYDPFFATLVNHVDLGAPVPADPDGLLRELWEAIEDGNVYISFGDAEQAAGFRFAVVAQSGAMTTMGDQRPYTPGLRLMTSRIELGEGGMLFRVVRNGEAIGLFAGESLSLPVDGPGMYRVEVFRYDWRRGAFYYNLRPWIFSNPVRITAG